MELVQQIIDLYQKSRGKAWKSLPFYKVECYWQIGKLLFNHYWEIVAQYTQYQAALKSLVAENPALPDAALLVKMTYFFTAFTDFKQVSPLLSWGHYLSLIKLSNKAARNYYYQEAVAEKWTLVQMEQAISNLQYERIYERNPPIANSKAAHLKTYFQFSFLKKFSGQIPLEKDLEAALVGQLQHFLAELGKGFAFVSQQKRLITPNGKQLFVDLLFYNYLLNRFILIDLKVVPLSYQHIGQMDTYCRLFNETTPLPDKKPCMGIILCTQIDPSLQHYSLLKDHPTLFAFEYTLATINSTKHQQRAERKKWEKKLFKNRLTIS